MNRSLMDQAPHDPLPAGVFDPARLADLVDEESRLATQLAEVSDSLNQQHATDGEWGEQRLPRYMADQQRHGQLTRQLETVRRAMNRYQHREPENAKKSLSGPMARWLRNGANGLEGWEREQYLREMVDGDLPNGGGETFRVQAATASDAASGQEAVQEVIPPRVIDRLAYYGGVAKMAQNFMTGTGGEYRIMQEDAASQEGEIIGAQDTGVAALDLANIGVQTFGAKTASSKSILLTREQLQDSVFDIQGYAERQAVRRMGRIWNKAFKTTQAGTGLPVGVVSSAITGIGAASATTFTWVETTDLIYKVPRAYRDEMGEYGEGGFMPEGGGMMGYMMSDDAERACRVMVDGDNRPLWVPSTREGVPNIYNGEPYVVNGHMAAVATGAIPMLYGNFSYYGIRTVQAIEMFRFMDSRTMQKNTIEVLAFSRRDGRPMGALVSGNCEAYAKLTMA